ncbi:condensation domain-containing protein [Plantactinospora sp. ZYX-F-223]|uniref:condensation domain-containing protein n=1 Tax=Plantactinospora sp. ZYX-F-223 TaxID=3144103 RepID=UPI0031FC9DF7
MTGPYVAAAPPTEHDGITGAQAPLSYAQQLLAAFAVHEGGSVFGPNFVNWCAHWLTGPVDVDVLRQALDDVVRRQGALRTVVVREEGFPFQRVRPPAPVPLTVLDRHETAPDDRDAEVARITARALAEGQPSDRVPLLAAYLARFGDASALVLVIHRTAADGWTMQLAIRDVMAGYERRLRGEPPDRTPLPQYVECALADGSAEREKQIRAALPYWERTLGDLPVVGIPADHPRPLDGTGGVRALHTFELSDRTVQEVRRAARAARTSFFTMLLTAYALSLTWRTGGSEIAIPVLGAGRSRQQWDTVGFFVNGHVLRLGVPAEQTLATVLARAHRAGIAAQTNDVPLIRVLEALPNIAASAFDSTTVVPTPIQLCQPIPDFADDRATVRYQRMKLPPEVVAEQPVMPVDFLWVMEPYTSFVVRVMYNPRMFDEASVARLAEDFQRALWLLVTTPRISVRTARAAMEVAR